MDSTQQHVLTQIAESDVHFVRLWFTDLEGRLKSVAIPPAEVEKAFRSGVGFDGSAVEGLTRVYESDMVLRPDAQTFQILPWSHGQDARMFADIDMRDGTPALPDPRSILKRALLNAEDAGFTFMVHPEIEFYLFQLDDDPTAVPVPIDSGSYFDHVSHSLGHNFRREAILMLEEMGIAVEFSHHESGPGQNEIDLRATDALTMADNIQTFRTVLEEVAINEGIRVSFMPKPFSDKPGSGMHLHVSLFLGDHDAFYSPTDRYGLSLTARYFLAGVLQYAAQMTAIENQHVNSFKRLAGGMEAPQWICWAPYNSTALVRVPSVDPHKPDETRFEVRSPDSAVNPYLAFAAILTAGMAGIDSKAELMEPIEEDVEKMTDLEREALGIKRLPTSLAQALEQMQRSELMEKMLGEEAFDFFLRNKRQEWDAYRRQVTDFERESFARF
ncbi:MAG: glutamine synthetase family protein [Actinomycetaceae bacterium]|nr:glutamine synthetase family protein [Actinomycetaceae bacterium]MDY6083063.1 glutamine synthetase family protein [Actinomycetaceae bacterium]